MISKDFFAVAKMYVNKKAQTEKGMESPVCHLVLWQGELNIWVAAPYFYFQYIH